jgi:hypothetical protein
MPSTISGFRNTLTTTVPEQVRDIRAKMLRLRSELEICHEDEAYLVAIARVAGISLEQLYESAGQAVCAEDESHA